jgi:hypothetical protein
MAEMRSLTGKPCVTSMEWQMRVVLLVALLQAFYVASDVFVLALVLALIYTMHLFVCFLYEFHRENSMKPQSDDLCLTVNLSLW